MNGIKKEQGDILHDLLILTKLSKSSLDGALEELSEKGLISLNRTQGRLEIALRDLDQT